MGQAVGTLVQALGAVEGRPFFADCGPVVRVRRWARAAVEDVALGLVLLRNQVRGYRTLFVCDGAGY